MRELRYRLLHFRGLLDKTLQAQSGSEDRFAKGIKCVTKALITDFDRMFSPNILKGSGEIHPLIEEHCHKWPGCPICGSKMHKKTGKFGVFYGCSKYPDCKGVRNEAKEVSMNDALRFYLTQKLYEEKLKEDTAESRFKNLDL